MYVDITTTPVTTYSTTIKPHYEIVKNPDDSIVTVPIDTQVPVAQTACGVQILTGRYTW